MHYLLKTEPGDYSYQDLEREKETNWTGVANPQAVKNLAAMKKGDELVIYHTGGEKTAVGLARVVSADAGDPRQPQIRIAAERPLAQPKTLAEMKQETVFADSPLLRQGRLSVVPLTAAQFDWIVRK